MEETKPIRLYVMCHAYHHFIVEVVEMLGPQRAKCRTVRRIQSDPRGWTRFFAEGMDKTQTTFTVFPDAPSLEWFAAFEWPHEILS